MRWRQFLRFLNAKKRLTNVAGTTTKYSLDRNDGLEQHILYKEPSAEDIYEGKYTESHIYSFFASLPDKQARRVFAHYFLGISNSAIAKAEGVTEKVVRMSIQRGVNYFLKSMKKSL